MHRAARLATVLAAVLVLPLLACSPASAAAWTPTPGKGWQWVLSSVPTAKQVAAATGVAAWDVDGFDTPASRVAEIKKRGAGAVCYFSAGSWEDWRPDAKKFPASLRGRALDGWAGEKWLDIRRRTVLEPLMAERMRMCRDKGFDAVEPDNVDGWTNRTGFPLTAADQLAYNRMLADTAHRLGLKIALKNDVDQVRELEPYFDWALNEECFAHDECDVYDAFRDEGKAVWVVEYDTPVAEFCPAARAAGFDAMRKRLELDTYRAAC
ncbi:endo alpha-1,4 polygalactosaminidase [Kineococcus glutinatus]|uniref:Endo alpha-1,4 polygalactosaminidase n=1 Tax=Kineococcus glutinatus TaxID=1070872 RepID=A0ABP9IAZ0_9ACTN